jgi:alkyldihydroxyacetonephosphate synthase
MSASSYAVWGWGGPADEPVLADLEALGPYVAETTGVAVQSPQAAAPAPALPASRRGGELPASLRPLASDDPVDRARHGIGRSYRDLVRGMRGELDAVPDLVLRPHDEQGVTDVLDWASSTGTAVVPFGGGSSVVGGVEPRGLDAAVSLDLSRLSGLVEVDATSRAVRLRAGTLGPAVEDALAPHGLTLRFYPQSFERSTVGGWLATRAAGHFSTRLTHVDDLVESVRAVTPVGPWESRRLPGSGAGPSPDRLLLGSEGSLGVITEAWLRAQPRPAHRWSATLAAPDLATGAVAVRRLVQSGLLPATCRLVDAARRRSPARSPPARPRSSSGSSRCPHRSTPTRPPRWSCAATPGCASSSRGGAARPGRRGGRRSCARPTCASRSCCSACWSRPSRQR